MEIRDKVLKHSSQMFVSLGVKNVTMDLLATEMGISKRTIYEHFKDKEELVIESILHMMRETNKENIQVIADSANVVEAMFLIMRRQEERRKLVPKVFQEDLKKYFPLAKACTINDKDGLRLISAPLNLLRKGVDQGVFRSDLQIDLVDSYLFEMISILHSSPLVHMINPEPSAVFRSIILPYFRGLCTQKGLDLMRTYFDDHNPF